MNHTASPLYAMRFCPQLPLIIEKGEAEVFPRGGNPGGKFEATTDSQRAAGEFMI